MRDAPALAIIPNLVDKGAKIRAHDPQGVEEAKKLLPSQIEYCDDLYETVSGADALVLLTEWNAYRGLDFNRVKDRMNANVVIDLRNVYEPEAMRSNGFVYSCIGRDY
jgi:UDPglucose 6-dehydrogenase